MCQRDLGEYCISYKLRYGLFDLNHIVFWKKFIYRVLSLNLFVLFRKMLVKVYIIMIKDRNIDYLLGFNHVILREINCCNDQHDQ